MDDDLTRVTGLSQRERKNAISWWNSLPETKAVDVLNDALSIYFQLKQSHGELSGKLNRYCSLILAARRNGWDTLRGKGFRVAKDAQFDDYANIRQAKVADLISRGRTPVLRKKILAHWGEIVEMKRLGNGFRPIAKYLLQHRKIKTSAVYLNRLWNEVNDK